MLIWVNVGESGAPHTGGMTAMLAQSPHETIEGWSLRPLAQGEAALAYPLLLALEPCPTPLPAWQKRVRDWLGRKARGQSRGIMTLRSQAGVIAGMFFYALSPGGATPAVLEVSLVRVIEPLGDWRGLGTLLRAVEALARELGCGGALLAAEADSPTWAQIAGGLDAIGRRHGYLRLGESWYRPLESAHGVVRLPDRRI